MEKKMYAVIVAVVVGSLARPRFEDIKEYEVSVEASSPEEAEKKAMDIIAGDPTRFDPAQNRIRIAEIKTIDGSEIVYKDDKDIYRRLARALRAYRMWPYLERCKEFAQDYCVYAGVSVEEAAKMVAADPDVASSPAREARGNQLTIAQQMLAEVKRQNAIRYERATQPKEDKTSAEPTEKKEPLYPEAGPERYHEQNPGIAKEMARQSKPEKVEKVITNEYTDFAKMESPALGTVNVTFNVTVRGSIISMTRRVSIRKDDKKDGVYWGYVYNQNDTYTGHWTWNLKYPYPMFKSAVATANKVGQANTYSFISALKKALVERGIKA